MATELAVSASVTTSSGSLDLDDGVNFRLGKQVEIGSVSWRKEVVTSPFVAGRFPVHEVKDAAESSISVHVLGSNHAALRSNLATLLSAFTEQSSYQLTMTVEGQTSTWTCERADYQVGFATETLAALVVPVQLSFFRHPEPDAGEF